jgi:hypothetical protein
MSFFLSTLYDIIFRWWSYTCNNRDQVVSIAHEISLNLPPQTLMLWNGLVLRIMSSVSPSSSPLKGLRHSTICKIGRIFCSVYGRQLALANFWAQQRKHLYTHIVSSNWRTLAIRCLLSFSNKLQSFRIYFFLLCMSHVFFCLIYGCFMLITTHLSWLPTSCQ